MITSRILTTSLITLMLLSLSACTSTADMTDQMIGLGSIKTTKETFDGSTTLTASPHRLYDPDRSMWDISIDSFFLGARWNSKHKDTVALTIEHRGSTSSKTIYLSIKKIGININGDINSYITGQTTIRTNDGYNEVTKTIYTQSRNSIIVPLSVLDDMVSAEDCKIRIYTNKGFQDFVFSVDRIPGGSGAARMSIRKFISAVKDVQSRF